MKIEFNMVLDIPSGEIDSLSDAEIRQMLFDHIQNRLTVNYLMDAVRMSANTNVSPETQAAALQVYKLWADIVSSATFDYTVLSEDKALADKEPQPKLNNFEIGLLHMLAQCRNTISFLYDCLEGNSTHAYPEQTREALKHIEYTLKRTIGIPQPCVHSGMNDDCPVCQDNLKFKREHVFDERLGW